MPGEDGPPAGSKKNGHSHGGKLKPDRKREKQRVATCKIAKKEKNHYRSKNALTRMKSWKGRGPGAARKVGMGREGTHIQKDCDWFGAS